MHLYLMLVTPKHAYLDKLFEHNSIEKSGTYSQY